jgi:SAM-dependent methyltransferase
LQKLVSAELGKKHYWDDFYSKQNPQTLALPSQFAAFVAQECAPGTVVLEIGCGTGRDSLFFARHGFRVLGIDGSPAAILACDAAKRTQAIETVSFHKLSVGSAEFDDFVQYALPEDRSGPTMAFARFFLHAITDDEEDALLACLSRVLRTGDRGAFEYRTKRDASLSKVTEDHYRRYAAATDLFAKATRLGFTIDYAVEGFGYAKYKHDDAFVARCILRKV